MIFKVLFLLAFSSKGKLSLTAEKRIILKKDRVSQLNLLSFSDFKDKIKKS